MLEYFNIDERILPPDSVILGKKDISISILRTGRDSETGDMMRHILAATGQSPLVLIAPGGVDHFRALDPEQKRRVAFAAEPVSLRDILNAINENC